jgi:acyl-coenzyme A synthetase/AMP-(fatty) acid ligase
LPTDDAVPIPIGSACANSEVFAVGESGAEAAVNEEGELFVRGPSLMDGYWGLAEQSARSLVPDPRLPERSGRVYRTGDIVRRDAEGMYHFVGRRDLQVKSRGYRIELGDIEATLHNHAGIAEAAVVALPHAEFGSTLHGIIAPRPGVELQRAELAAWCAASLPPYMVPAGFEIRASLPKTSNGKVDRSALQRELQKTNQTELKAHDQ